MGETVAPFFFFISLPLPIFVFFFSFCSFRLTESAEKVTTHNEVSAFEVIDETATGNGEKYFYHNLHQSGGVTFFLSVVLVWHCQAKQGQNWKIQLRIYNFCCCCCFFHEFHYEIKKKKKKEKRKNSLTKKTLLQRDRQEIFKRAKYFVVISAWDNLQSWHL